MDSALIGTIVAVVVGALFALLQKYVDKRYNKAKEAVEKNSADIDNMATVVTGFKTLTEEYRTKIDEQEETIKMKDQTIADLRQQLLLKNGGSV